MKDELVSDSLIVALNALCHMTESLHSLAKLSLVNAISTPTGRSKVDLLSIKNGIDGILIIIDLIDNIQKLNRGDQE
jgi:hypothetical protein